MNSTTTAASKRIDSARHRIKTRKDTRTTWILHSSPWLQKLLLLTLDLWEACSACRVSFPEEASLKKCCLHYERETWNYRRFIGGKFTQTLRASRARELHIGCQEIEKLGWKLQNFKVMFIDFKWNLYSFPLISLRKYFFRGKIKNFKVCRLSQKVARGLGLDKVNLVN